MSDETSMVFRLALSSDKPLPMLRGEEPLVPDVREVVLRPVPASAEFGTAHTPVAELYGVLGRLFEKLLRKPSAYPRLSNLSVRSDSGWVNAFSNF